MRKRLVYAVNSKKGTKGVYKGKGLNMYSCAFNICGDGPHQA
jgi:hypothetical protein